MNCNITPSNASEQVIIHRGVENSHVNILDFTENNITFEVVNVPIHTFDQHARARVGHKFFEYHIAETPVYSLYTVTYDRLHSDPEKLAEFKKLALELEELRKTSNHKESYNLMSRNCCYKVTVDYSALAGQMSRRLKFCEEEQIVKLFWELRAKMIEKGIKFAEQYLPGCDKTGTCDYIDVSDHLSSVFNALFSACGRHKTDVETYRSFNQSCTTPRMLIDQAGLEIPKSKWEIEQNIEY